MRFELTVALKYLIPKWRQLSVSIISLISVLVISLVVWLVVLFLSVTDGIEKKWIEELVALNAPVRMTPTEAYYHSYYYLIDSVCLDSNYTSKTIGEKLTSLNSDPYDPRIDRELPLDFPTPDRHSDGRLKDPIKEGFEAIHALSYRGVRPQEYEMNFANLRLTVMREGATPAETEQTFLTQIAYVASHDGENKRISQMITPPSAEDYNNLLRTLALIAPSSGINASDEEPFQEAPENLSDHLKQFFDHLVVQEVRTADGGFILPPALFPESGSFKGIGIIRNNQVARVVIPKAIEELAALQAKLQAFGHTTTLISLLFDDKQPHLSSEESFNISPSIQIFLDEAIPFQANLKEASLQNAQALASLEFHIEGYVQNIPISGETFYTHLEIAKAQPKANGANPLWVNLTSTGISQIPKNASLPMLGEGLLVSNFFKKNGVRLGDRGYIAYYTLTGSSMQEQRIPVYIAGFYDPGMIPLGNKLIFADKKITSILRGHTAVTDPMLGNGINIWLEHLADAEAFKEDLIKSLKARGIDHFWNVQSYHDYELTRPIIEQLKSDKHLFTLIALIILVVACSNIISMLILLVNDKKKEIGILQSMGASPARIACIFGLCGFATGLISCIIGVSAAILTLKHLQSLIALLSFLQGRDAFQAAFYGSALPNQLSYPVMSLVLIATLLISLLAGIIPAIKASKIRPSDILRSE